jgi:transitional endoplasmic reticulum ATPase
MDHFEHALDEVTASVTDEVRERYEEIEQRFGTDEGEVATETEASRTFH